MTVATGSSYKCPGSGSLVHAWAEVTVKATGSCDTVMAEMKARASDKSWVDPHNGGIYSVLSSNANELNTQRTTNPQTSVGGKLYTDKQTFTFKSSGDGGCEIQGCSESQGFSIGDFSTNYCDMRNLYCGKADGCSPVLKDFTSEETDSKKSIGAGHDFSKCVVHSNEVSLASLSSGSEYKCPGSGS